MSRSPHLPPRCPPQGPQITGRDDSLFTQSCRFPSEDPFFGEPPCWLDDLLADSVKKLNLPLLRRACSDSDAILDAMRTFRVPIFSIEGDLQPAGETGDSLDAAVRGESGSGVEVSCVYGPNSPRQKCRLTSSESSIVNAVLENVPSNSLQYLTIDPSTGLHGNVANAEGDACDDVNHLDQDKPFKSSYRIQSYNYKNISCICSENAGKYFKELKGDQAKDLGSGNFNTLLILKELWTLFRTWELIWL
uniref:Uncharacterized protein n=1 Tax=Hordeum vulgare subsp. vulgare TaxID=112509 RepID=A0A8I6YD48_HORVV